MSVKIESSLGKVMFNRQQTPKVLTVEDSSIEEYNQKQNFSDPESRLDRVRELESVRAESKQLRKQAPVEAKNRLDILLGIARSAKDVEVEGVIFSIRSLKAKEIREITERLTELNTNSEVINRLDMRNYMIAFSLYAIDGQDIDLVIGSNSIEDRVEFVGELDESLLQYLANVYWEMKADNDKRFSDLGKDQGEIEDNIKKS